MIGLPWMENTMPIAITVRFFHTDNGNGDVLPGFIELTHVVFSDLNTIMLCTKCTIQSH